jgi:hypothetical protein
VRWPRRGATFCAADFVCAGLGEARLPSTPTSLVRGALCKELTRYLRADHANAPTEGSFGHERPGRAATTQFSVKTGVVVFFCDPRSPRQRGSNENTNRLLRQYFPKRTEIAHYSQAEFDAVAAELNGRPRRTLGWKTPSQALDEALR